MNQNLRLEVFSSNTCVTPVEFYEYRLKSKEVQKSTFEIIRGACLKLSNINYSNSIFENGKKIIPENVEYEINSIKEVEESLVTSFESNNSIYLDITVVCKNKSVENKIKEICEKYDVLHKINNICITDNKLKRNKLGKLVRNNW